MIRLLEHLRHLIFIMICIKYDLSYAETILNVQNVLDNVFSHSVYNKEIRGKTDLSETLEVNVSFSLMYIKGLDEIEEEIEMFGVLILNWKDERLIWDPVLYNGTYKVYMTADKVWRPELTLENPSSSRNFYGDITRLMSVHRYNGEASLIIGDMYDCSCSIDLTSFPWDKQTCAVKFIVWGYVAAEVKLVGAQNEINLEGYQSNGIWELISTKVYSKPHPLKSLLAFEMVLQRRPMFFIVNILLPITTLSVLQLFVFVVPIDSGERISFSLTVLLSISVYMTLISDNLPPGAESMASMCYLLVFIMIESAFTCLCNIVSVALYYRHLENYELCSFWYKFINIFNKTECCRPNGGGKVDVKPDVQEKDNCVDNEDNFSIIDPSENMKEKKVTWKDVSKAFDRATAIFMTLLLCFSFTMYAYHVLTGLNTK